MSATGSTVHEPKDCRSCGRRIEWRRKWERNWDSVVYCSDACRARKVRTVDVELEAWLLARLKNTSRGGTVDPTDAAQALGMEAEALRESARSAARRLVNRGLAEMVQRGVVVDPSTAKGPVSLRQPR
ncbi:DUF2256 domain-containing protein [Arthrobacter echini]|uniref:DUF2256 domain-containing protein n=1 Tax=Arthrobacter echini TaxID=1529066 RepID=A0A4S5EA64_9MICC|nr:DUF2256 and DUF3253 domain-containing protein [Arthrobacter echini]THJ68616.1 DUF2256 domain-containing protein [Arthrobacter echini]